MNPAVPSHFNLFFRTTCPCGNDNPNDFYMMKAEGLREDNTFGFLDRKFRLVCKKCDREFAVELVIKEFMDAKKS